MSVGPPGDQDPQKADEVPIFYLRPPGASSVGPAGPTGPIGEEGEATTAVIPELPAGSHRLVVPAIVAAVAVVAIVTTLVLVLGGGTKDIGGVITTGPVPDSG